MSGPAGNGHDDIAIIGMSGRFPGAADLDEFWRNLRDGVESVVRFSDEQLSGAGTSAETYNREDFVRTGPWFEGMSLFDADFFGYTAREARIMDPQHRLFLETAWEALEDAGYDVARCPGSVGVFAGAGANRYVPRIYADQRLMDSVGLTQVLVGNELGYLTSRVSYKLDLTGPSVAVRTACSTALVALDAACRSLLDGACDMALSGGVFVDPTQGSGYLYQEGSFRSADGHCRPFDADARGTIFGSGVGVVVLRRLADALADGDTVLAVIKGSAVNNDGATKVGFTAPSIGGQAQVISAALDRAGLTPSDIDYIEGHGTATPMGDPIEVQALSRVFRGAGPIGLGSVKGNIGHLDAASGIVGLMKLVLSLQHEMLPPSGNFASGNPEIGFEETPFRVVSQARPWKRSGRVRRAGVSAFGFGGTNAHLVVEEAPVLEPGSPTQRAQQLLVVSARSTADLERATDRLAARLGGAGAQAPELADVAFTLAVGRRQFPFRRAVWGADTEEIVSALQSRSPGASVTAECHRESPNVVFVFGGQGSQYQGMGKELYEQEEVYRECVDRCAKVLDGLLGRDIRPVILAGEDGLLARTEWAQPALFVTEFALVELWRRWGVVPSAVLGHSLGELVAACVAGVFSLEDALALVVARGRLMGASEQGGMVSLAADRVVVQAVLPDGLAVAAHNGPRDCVVAGPAAAIEAFAETAVGNGWNVQWMSREYGFHSDLMDSAAAGFREAVAGVGRSEPVIPMISGVTGEVVRSGEVVDPAYWGTQLRSCVEFSASIRSVVAIGDVFLEVGAGPVLSGMVRRLADGAVVVSSLPHRNDQRGATGAMMRALGRLWAEGVAPAWEDFYAGQRRRRVRLPSYPFNRAHHWIDERSPTVRVEEAVRTAAVVPPGDGDDLASWFYEPSWTRSSLPLHGATDLACHWLVLNDPLGVGEQLARRLLNQGATVTAVAAGAVVPASAADYEALVDEVRRAGGDRPLRVVHCWGVTAEEGPGADDEETQLRLGFESLILLIQAMVRRGLPAPVAMWLLSTGMHDVVGTEQLSAVKATALGPCRVIPRELPGTRCHSIDLDLAGSPNEAQIDQILAEFAHEPTVDTQIIAHRSGHRWTLQYLPRPLPKADDLAAGLRRTGCYLITGGTGGLGLELTERLAEHGARVVLVARSALPEADRLDPSAGRPHEVARRLELLRRSGAEILLLQADVSDLQQMRDAVQQAVHRFGTVHGVFHAAGVPGGGLIQLKGLDEAAAVLRPKVRGTLVLEQALAGLTLDFMVLFGSVGAAVGHLGQVDYCAANSFLDAFAQDRNRRGRVVTVDWGAWKAVGMAAAGASDSGRTALRGLDERGMSLEQGLQALARVLQHTTGAQVIVTPVALSEAFERVLRISGTQAATPTGGEGVPPADQTSASTSEDLVLGVWREMLGTDHVEPGDNFFDIGGNSLTALQVVSAVNERAGSRLTMADLYEGMTAGYLSSLIELGRITTQSSPGESAPAESVAGEQRRQNMQRRLQQRQRRRAGVAELVVGVGLVRGPVGGEEAARGEGPVA